jgi:hypothetical protein
LIKYLKRCCQLWFYAFYLERKVRVKNAWTMQRRTNALFRVKLHYLWNSVNSILLFSLFKIYLSFLLRSSEFSISYNLRRQRRRIRGQNIKCKLTYPWASQLGGWFFCSLLRHVSIEDDVCTWSLLYTVTQNSLLNFSLSNVQQYKNVLSIFFSLTHQLFTH